MSATPELILRRGEERRLLRGHMWVYSNEVDTDKTPLADFAPGAAVDIYSHRKRWLGNGYVNPQPLICARIVSRDRDHPLTASLIVHRLKVALALRQRLFERPFYRLVFGESDGLPGLVIDRYGEICVVQITTAGMEARRAEIARALEKVLRPRGVLYRCDLGLRQLEGLDAYVESSGELDKPVIVDEDGAEFRIDLHAQKTGWYFDQRDNRRRFAPLARGLRVLDMCCYVGGWGIQAARHGAARAVCVDSSQAALDQVAHNAERNNVMEIVDSRRGDVFEFLRQQRDEPERFDLIVLDPPAFAKRKKDTTQALRAYQRLNQEAMRVLGKDGLLISCSCSYHIARDAFLGAAQQAARHVDRSLQLIAEGGQAADHPIHPAMPETRYLKCLVMRVLPRT